MRVVRNIVSAIASVALATAFVAAGFAVCVAPPATHVLANVFSDDATSPFGRAQLVAVADATRDYAFGNHDERALYQAIYQVDREYRQGIEAAGGRVPADFPHLDAVTDMSSADQMRAAFAGASELYCFSPETVSHLDDCHNIARIAYPASIVIAAIALAGLVFAGVTGGKRRVGGVLLAAGIVVIVAVAALGVCAFIDFSGFFAAFHNVFFSQGNWVFPYDSLLICALPTPFWMGMGAVWLVVAFALSLLSILVGLKLRRSR